MICDKNVFPHLSYVDLYDTNLKWSYEIVLTFHAAVDTSNAGKPYFDLIFNNRGKERFKGISYKSHVESIRTNDI